MEKMYHIGLDQSLDVKYAILPGDPGRVAKIASYLDQPVQVGQNREYTSYVGFLEGEKVLVMSTGMGGPSTAIGVEELHRIGVHTAIRIGTCGGMKLDVKGGDIVIANAAIRMDGTSKEYVPLEFPAVADFAVTQALIESAETLGADWHVGVVHCKDSFYGQHCPDRMPIGYELQQKWDAWMKAGTLASEMESSTLFILGQILEMRTGCVLQVIWNKDRIKAGLPDTEDHDTAQAIKIALGALAGLIQEDRNANQGVR